MDWMSFTTDKLAQDLHSKAEAVKSVDGKHITTSHSGAPSVSTSPFDDHGVPDDWNVNKTDYEDMITVTRQAASDSLKKDIRSYNDSAVNLQELMLAIY